MQTPQRPPNNFTLYFTSAWICRTCFFWYTKTTFRKRVICANLFSRRVFVPRRWRGTQGLIGGSILRSVSKWKTTLSSSLPTRWGPRRTGASRSIAGSMGPPRWSSAGKRPWPPPTISCLPQWTAARSPSPGSSILAQSVPFPPPMPWRQSQPSKTRT